MIRCPAFLKVVNIVSGSRQLFSTSLCITVDVSNFILISLFQPYLDPTNTVLDLLNLRFAFFKETVDFSLTIDLSSYLISSLYSVFSGLSSSSIGAKSSYYLAILALILLGYWGY